MALLSGVSWLCTVLLLGYICFPPQQGYSFSHGYSPHDDEFRNHENVFDPLKSNQDSDGHMYERQSSVFPHQSDPVQYEDGEDTGSVTSQSEAMAQSNPDSNLETEQPTAAPSSRSVLSSDLKTSGAEHPFGLLLKEHTQQNNEEGVSFPTIANLKQFIGRMKNSFLKPGSDLRRHFQTARDVIKKIASEAQNTEGEPDSVNTPDSRNTTDSVNTPDSVKDEAGENELWSESIQMEFEQSEQHPNYQNQSESLRLIEPGDSAVSSITSNHGPGIDSAFHQHQLLAEHVPDDNEWANNGVETFLGAPRSQNYDPSTHSVFSEQIPSGLFFGEDLSFPHSTDDGYHSSKTTNIQPLTAEKNIRPSTHKPDRANSVAGHHRPSAGNEVRQDFLKDEAGRVIHTNVISAPQPNSYVRSKYVNAQRNQLPEPEDVPKQRERPVPAIPSHQPPVGQELNHVTYTPSVQQPVAVASASSSESPSKESISGNLSTLISSPHYVKPLSLYPGGYHTEQRVHTSIYPAQVKNDNSLHPNSVGSDSSQIEVFSRLADQKVKSRKSGVRNMSGRNFRFLPRGIFGAQRQMGSFPTKQGFSLNGGFPREIRAGPRQTFFQPHKFWKHPAFVDKGSRNSALRHLRALSRVFDSAGLFWRTGVNTKRLFP